MVKIICGTNRSNSNSAIVAEHYKACLKEKGGNSEIIDLIDLPQDFIATALYENSGQNELFNAFVDKMAEGEKYIFVIAEYNGSFPGVLKAFIDGMPYPSCMADKKAALVGLSAGEQGGLLAMSHFSDILNYLGVNVLAQKVRLPFMGKLLENGKIPDGLHKQLIQEQIERLIKF